MPADRHDVRPRSASTAAIAPDTPKAVTSRSASTHLTSSDPGGRRAVSHPQTRPLQSTGARAKVVEVTPFAGKLHQRSAAGKAQDHPRGPAAPCTSQGQYA